MLEKKSQHLLKMVTLFKAQHKVQSISHTNSFKLLTKIPQKLTRMAKEITMQKQYRSFFSICLILRNQNCNLLQTWSRPSPYKKIYSNLSPCRTRNNSPRPSKKKIKTNLRRRRRKRLITYNLIQVPVSRWRRQSHPQRTNYYRKSNQANQAKGQTTPRGQYSSSILKLCKQSKKRLHKKVIRISLRYKFVTQVLHSNVSIYKKVDFW